MIQTIIDIVTDTSLKAKIVIALREDFLAKLDVMRRAIRRCCLNSCAGRQRGHPYRRDRRSALRPSRRPGSLQPLFAQITESADMLVLCGDLTDYGLPEEARALAREIPARVKIPAVAVLGNHDYESGQQDEIRKILSDAGVSRSTATPPRSTASASPA